MGLSAKGKFFLQIVASLCVAVTLVMLTASGTYSTQLSVPFFEEFSPGTRASSLIKHPLPLGRGIPAVSLFVVSVMVGASNAVNLTDGLDGLAIGCVVVAAGALTVLTYVTSHAPFRRTLICSIFLKWATHDFLAEPWVGSSLGFSVQRASREVFMGDVGSLALGGSIGMVAVAIKQEILCFLLRRFVLEALSVILQVISFRLTGSAFFGCLRCIIISSCLDGANRKIIVRRIARWVLRCLRLTTLKLR